MNNHKNKKKIYLIEVNHIPEEDIEFKNWLGLENIRYLDKMFNINMIAVECCNVVHDYNLKIDHGDYVKFSRKDGSYYWAKVTNEGMEIQPENLNDYFDKLNVIEF